MNLFHLSIRTPEKEAFKGKVSSLTFDADKGRMHVLPHHASMTTVMTFSSVVVKTEEKDEEFIARRGIFLFDNRKNEAVMLCLTCDLKSEIDHKTALEYLKFISEKLANHESLSDYQIKYLEGEKFAVERQVKLTK